MGPAAQIAKVVEAFDAPKIAEFEFKWAEDEQATGQETMER